MAKDIKSAWADLHHSLVAYFSLDGFLVTQQETEASIREGISFKGTNLLILIFAILIASLGLNTNSTAVIIGAMLISPLMGPIIGIGLGVGIADFELLKRSGRNLAIAAGFSVVASCLYFLISPVNEGHSELLARTSPTIYDVLIGFFGGAAGIVAIASKNKGNVIPGVAIATALMPPLCTAGYGLATWQMNYFLGAFYLFIINSIYIGLATFVGVKLMKFHKSPVAPGAKHQQIVGRVVYVVAILALAPSIYLTYRMFVRANFEQNAARFVTEMFQFPQTHVLTRSADIVDGRRQIDVTLIGQPLPQDSLELAMLSHLRYYGLEGAQLNIIQDGASTVNPADVLGSSVKDIYNMAQATITRKQAVIDSLRTALDLRAGADTIAAAIAPELRVVFPQVKDIALTRAVFGNVQTGRMDTAMVALVQFNASPNAALRQKLTDYLAARTSSRTVRLVTIQ